MAKVTMNPQPEVSADPVLPDDIVIDAKNRRLKIKEPDFLQESRVSRMMGQSAMNMAYMAMYVQPAIMVCEIDGEPQRFPTNELEVEAAIGRLGREGQAAVMKLVEARIAAEEAKKKDDASALKN